MKNKKIITGKVVYLGVNPIVGLHQSTQKVTMIENEGILGDKHCFHNRRIDVREESLISKGFKKGGIMANLRQVTIMSGYDWKMIMNKAELCVDHIQKMIPDDMPPINFILEKEKEIFKFYGATGENIVIQLFDKYSEKSTSSIPPGAEVFFVTQNIPIRPENFKNASMFITSKNNPCNFPNKEIVNRIARCGYSSSSKNFDFERFAIDHRGLCGIVQTGGSIEVGDTIIIELP